MDWTYTGSVGFLLAVALGVILVYLPFNWRSPVSLKRREIIRAPRHLVWQALAYAPGENSWHPYLRRIAAVSGAPDQERPEQVRLEHELGSDKTRRQTWTYDIEISEKEPGRALSARRLGLDPANLNDRLIDFGFRLRDLPAGTEVTWHENWGPRSIAGRFMAHTDAARTLSHLRSFCETGRTSNRRAAWRSSTISALSALTTVAAFGVLLGLPMAILLVIILVIHEIGHLLSFRMVGQPWGRIMFVPFIGGVAVSRMHHEKLSDDVFCALMGAGLSIILLVPAALYSAYHPEALQTPRDPLAIIIYGVAALAGAVNLLNLLPIFPLDGGRVVRAMVQSVAPDKVQHLMFAIAGIIGGAALYWQNSILAALAIIAFFQSARLKPASNDIIKMDLNRLAVLGLAYAALIAAHGAALWVYMPLFI